MTKGISTSSRKKTTDVIDCQGISDRASIYRMSPSKLLSFHHDENLMQPQSILNLSSYTASLASSSSPVSGMSHDSGDGRSSSSSPNHLNNSMYSGYGHACSHCTSSFLTRDLLEKHELMHISNATMVSFSSFFFFTFLNPFMCSALKSTKDVPCCCCYCWENLINFHCLERERKKMKRKNFSI